MTINFASTHSYFTRKEPYIIPFIAEDLADGCFAPIRWLSNGRIKSYQIHEDFRVTPVFKPVSTFLIVIRTIVAIATIIPLTCIGLLARSLAGCHPLILAKRQVINNLNNKNDYYKTMIPTSKWCFAPKNTCLIIEREIGKAWGKVGLFFDQKLYAVYPYHAPSGKIFNRDTPSLIREKAVKILFLATPLRTVLRLIFLSLKLTMTLPYRVLDGQITLLQASTEACKTIYNIACAALFAIPLTCTALLAIVAPLYGRMYYNIFETRLNLKRLTCFIPLATVPKNMRNETSIHLPQARSCNPKTSPEAVVDTLYYFREY